MALVEDQKVLLNMVLVHQLDKIYTEMKLKRFRDQDNMNIMITLRKEIVKDLQWFQENRI